MLINTLSPISNSTIEELTGSTSSSTAKPSNQLYPRDLSINMRVMVTTKDGKTTGIIKFIGHTSFSPGIWIGVALDIKTGKNDGSVSGRRYFECNPEHGIFVKEEAVEPIIEEKDTISINSYDTNNITNGCIDKRGSITGLLKLKLSSMMELLNHQLEIVVELEEEDRQRNTTTNNTNNNSNNNVNINYSKRTSELHAEIVNMTNKELSMINAFKQHLHDRLPRDFHP